MNHPPATPASRPTATVPTPPCFHPRPSAQRRAHALLAACLLASTFVASAATADRHAQARAGDIVAVRLEALRPTQGAVGHDQIRYTLARWLGDPDRPTWRHDPAQHIRYLRRTVGKKFEDYCTDTGQGGLADHALVTISALRSARLDQPDSFACRAAPGTHAQALKSVVVGWDGRLYLTDGHHSFTSYYEVADGGPSLMVWVRVDANLYDTGNAATFWQHLVDARKAWLRDGDNQPITPAQLPDRLGLAGGRSPGGLQDDPYRALAYFARGIGFSQGDLPPFAEFLWADWLRARWSLADYARADPSSLNAILSPSHVERADLSSSGSDTSYAAAVRDAARLISATARDEVIANQYTAGALNRLTWLPDAPARSPTGRARQALDALTRNDIAPDGSPRTGGRLWYAVNYQRCGPPAAGTACWGY